MRLTQGTFSYHLLQLKPPTWVAEPVDAQA
jgi:hypothetical protein